MLVLVALVHQKCSNRIVKVYPSAQSVRFSSTDPNLVEKELFRFPSSEVDQLLELVSSVHSRTHGHLNYLEYGSGGTTTEIAGRFSLAAVSIEHDEAACELARNRLRTRELHHVRMLCAPPEENIPLLNKTSPEHVEYLSYQSYVNAIDNVDDLTTYDIVFLNGPVNWAAALRVLPHTGNNTLVVLRNAGIRESTILENYYADHDGESEGLTPFSGNGLTVVRPRRRYAGKKNVLRGILSGCNAELGTGSNLCLAHV